jgi:uncharacterized protein YndB with AHSA1/START domain
MKERKMVVESSAGAESTAERELTITRLFDAPRPLVFKAWSAPEHLARWWGPPGFTLPVCEMDFRPGGAYRYCMRSPQGNDMWVRGVYREIVEPERLVLSGGWEDADGKVGRETVTTVIFEERGGKTKLTLHNGIFESVASRDSHRGGWSASIERLAQYLAAVR